jgi:zinc protease
MKQLQSYFFKALVLIAILMPSVALAQEQFKKPVPLDPEVRYGKLDNGLTYYIKHNEKTEQRAEFYLTNNVGAILETDAQNGLAHFCEHMCFNGTKNFPDKGILNYFETIGMQFGRNINAGTGKDMTNYMLMQTPLTREGIIDTALLTLKDWSHNVSFVDAEIDNERGVIHEEWRTRRNANFRLNSILNPMIYAGSKYAIRDIIGSLDVIDHCEYKELKNFYKAWYRPDLQAIIVVGDIDIDQIEAKIKEYFSEIPAKENAKERPTYDVPDNVEPIIAIATDKEAQNTNIRVYYKHNYVKPSEKDMMHYINSYKEALYTTMLSTRLNELVQKENPPFIFAFNYYGNFAGNKDAYTLGASSNNIKQALTALLIENKRVKDHGFTLGELERAKTDLLRGLEKDFKEKDQQQNRNLAYQYVSHFASNSPTPGAAFDYDFAQKVLPMLPLEEINKLSAEWITDKNMVISITGPEKEDIEIPTKEDVSNILSLVNAMSVEAYIDEVSNKPLMENIPEAGKIVKETKNEELGTTEWTLSNGVKVVIKPTDFKDDEILINAFSKGGTSLYSVEDLPSAEFATTVVGRSGISEFSLIELQKMLTGKVVQINPYIGELYEGFNGNCAPSDLETTLQMLNLHFTNPRFDEAATNAFMSRYKAYLQNKSLNPDAVFGDSVMYILANRNPRKEPLSIDRLNKVNFEKAKEIYLDRFADASDFTFVITGNIDIETAKALFETYVASLPSINRKENWKDNEVRYPKGKVNSLIEKELETQKNSIFINLNGDFEYNLENRLLLNTIKHVLDIRYTKKVREEEGGTYGVGLRASTSEYPVEDFGLNINFDCDPANAEKLKSIIFAEIENIKTNGPSQINLDKAKENFLKNRENALKENRFWSNSIVFNLQHDENILDTEKYNELVNAITIKKVQKAANKLLSQGNMIEIMMQPL